MATLLLLLTVLDHVQKAFSAPTVAFPVNSQLPPVARVGKPFSYSFSPYTFQSDFNITYSLGHHPSWIALESDQLRLFGTPDDSSVPPDDVFGQSVEIIASDSTGRASHEATLVVSRNKGPSVKIPMEEQISSFGTFSAPASLLSYPSKDFEFSFDRNTFDHNPAMINYYAVSGNSSPLPSWIKFDADSMTFFGTTPPFETLIQPPQLFSFALVASDIVGFSAASVSFSIVVGNHRLTTEEPIISLNATPGSPLRYDGLARGLRHDEERVSPGDVQAATRDMPHWLAFDSKTWRIGGTPEEGDNSANFTITFQDSLADTLDVLIMVEVEGDANETKLFKSTLEDIEVKPGEDLHFDLAKYFEDPEDVEVHIETKPRQSWLQQDGLMMTGKPPRTASGSFQMSVGATSKSSGDRDTQTLGAQFLELSTAPTSSSSRTRTPTHTDTHPTSTRTDSPEADSGGSGNTTILLATIIPILVVALLLMLLICILRRRRARRTYLSGKARSKNANRPESPEYNYGSDVSVQHVEEVVYNKPRKGMRRILTPMREKYNAMTTRVSTRSVLSDSTGHLSIQDLPPGFMVMGPPAPGMSRSSRSFDSGSARESWLTIEGSGMGRGSPSDPPYLESRRQLLPPPSFLTDSTQTSLSDALDLTVPPLFDVSPSIQQTPIIAYQHPGQVASRASIDGLSTSTSSSAALPQSHGYKHGRSRTNSTERTVPGSLDEEPIEQVAELRPLTRIHMPLQRQVSPQGNSPGWEVGSPSGVKGFRGLQSSKSAENWRPVQIQDDDNSAVYRELVDEAPFHPSRPNTAGSDDEDRGRKSQEPLPLSGDIRELSLRKKRPPSRRMRANTGPREGDEDRVLTGASQGSFKVFI